MKIINIKKLNKKYKIELENNKCLFLSENTIINYNLIKKIDLTKNKLEEIIHFENKEIALSKVINYLSYSSRTEYEIKQYLKKKEMPEEIWGYVIEKLKEYKYIDDEKYAREYVKDSFYLKKKGPLYIKNKLKEKQILEIYIDSNICDICTEDILIDNSYEIIKKSFYVKNEPKNKKIQKITTKLYTNGYSFDIINKAFKIFFENYEEKVTDYSIIEKYYDKAYNRLSKKYFEKYVLKQKIIENLMRNGFSYDTISDYFFEIDF